jgi:hypothetical protein
MARKLLRPMTAGDVAKALTVLELTRIDGTIDSEAAAAMFDVSPRTIQYWLNDREPRRHIPNVFAAIIRLMIDGRIERNEMGRV